MDNNKLLIGILCVGIAAFVALPFLTGGDRGRSSAPRGQPAATATADTPPPPPPALTAADLVNTTWDVPTGQGIVRVQLYSGGQLVATPSGSLANTVQSLTGSTTLQGTWTLTGANLTVQAQVGPITQKTTCQVQGTGIVCEGQPATRVQ